MTARYGDSELEAMLTGLGSDLVERKSRWQVTRRTGLTGGARYRSRYGPSTTPAPVSPAKPPPPPGRRGAVRD